MFDKTAVDEMTPGPELARLLAAVDPATLDDRDVLCYLRAAERQRGFDDAQRVHALARFAELNSELDEVEQDLHSRGVGGAPRLLHVGGEGTPAVHEFCFAEIAAELACSQGRAERLVAEALDLRYRLPQTLDRLRGGELSGYRASLIARGSHCLPAAGAAALAEKLGATAARVGVMRVGVEVERLLIEFDPTEAARRARRAAEARYVGIEPDADGTAILSGRVDAFDAAAFNRALDTVADMLKRLGASGDADNRRAQALGWLADPAAALRLAAQAGDDGAWPQATVYVHMRPGVFARDEDGAAILEGQGPITADQAMRALGHHRVSVQPVIDLHHMPESASDTFTGRLREAAILKHPTTVFPYSDHSPRHADIDHSKPRAPTDAPVRGPTTIDNSGPLVRREHRVRTHGGWQHAQPFNGVYVWLSPRGRLFVIDRKGRTHHLGDAA